MALEFTNCIFNKNFNIIIPSFPRCMKNFHISHLQCREHLQNNNKLLQITVYNYVCYTYSTGHAVAQLVEALRYKPEGPGFDSRWCH